MKIAFFLSTSGHSGVDRSMQLLIPALLERGYAVDLIKVQRHGPYFKTALPGLRVIELPTRHTLSALPGLVRYLKAESPAVLLSDKDRANRVALLARRLAGVATPVVVSSGTIMSINLQNRSYLERWLHRLSMNYLYPAARAVIVPSIDAADDLAAISALSRQSITVVPLPIIAPNIGEKAEQPVMHPWFQPDQLPVFLAVGELCERKDQATIIRAFAALLQHQPEAGRLVLLGEGKSRKALEALVSELGLEASVAFLGFQPNPYAYIKRARVLVHAARFEGFGMVLVEALYLGTPVIAAHCLGGPAEILQQGRLGALVPVGDASAFAEAMAKATRAELPSGSLLREPMAPYTLAQSTDQYLACMGLPSYATQE